MGLACAQHQAFALQITQGLAHSDQAHPETAGQIGLARQRTARLQDAIVNRRPQPCGQLTVQRPVVTGEELWLERCQGKLLQRCFVRRVIDHGGRSCSAWVHVVVVVRADSGPTATIPESDTTAAIT